MPTQVQFRRGTTTQNNSFTGAVGEISVDTTLDTIRVHDGSTAGGTRLAKFSEIQAGDITGVTAGTGLSGGGSSGDVTVNLSHLGLESLSDPNDDRIFMWDDSASAAAFLDMGTGISISGTTLAIGQAVATTDDVTFADIAATGNVTITGNLDVNGTTTTLDTTNSTIADRLIELGNGTTGTPANDMGLVLERGDSDNAFIGWDESADKFLMGTGSFTGASTGDLTVTTGTLVANLEGNVTGNLTGTASAVAANSVALGTHTTGNYMVQVSGGDGITISHTQGEGSTATITGTAIYDASGSKLN
mgnify:CR=1 FL=1